MYKFEFEIFKYNCNLYLSNGVGWLKLANTKDCLLHSTGSLVSVVLWQVTQKNQSSLVSVHINQHKNDHFYHTNDIKFNGR
jgi:hypothetical protein